MSRSTVLVLPLACCALLASGCGGKTVAKDKIEKQIQTAFAQKGFTAPVKSVSCPKDLEAKVGKTEKCTLTYKSGHALEVTATIKSVSGDKANFGFVITKRLK